jgi:hypothetical protein
MVAPCVADLLKINKAVNDAKRGSDYVQRFPGGLKLDGAVVLTLCDSGHANSNPESDEVERYRSVGGHFLLVAEACVMDNKPGKVAVMDYRSSTTQRVCRSTLAAEASHLADSLEAAEWLSVLLDEAVSGKLNLKDWQSSVQKRTRVFVTDAQSVYDYLTKDGSSLSRDKRMAIEGALLKEALRQPNTYLRWIDGLQNIADILTKEGADMEYFRSFLKTGTFTLVQDPTAEKIKERKREQRANRKEKQKVDKSASQQRRREQAAASLPKDDLEDSDVEIDRNRIEG